MKAWRRPLVSCLMLTFCTAFADAGEAIALFNGKDFTGWAFCLTSPETDPAMVWTVADGVIHCAGEPAGYMRTEAEYANYRLSFQWRWPKTGGNSGLLLHIAGDDRVWPKSIESQLQSGHAGDFWVIGGAEFKEHVKEDDRRVPKMHKHKMMSTSGTTLIWTGLSCSSPILLEPAMELSLFQRLYFCRYFCLYFLRVMFFSKVRGRTNLDLVDTGHGTGGDHSLNMSVQSRLITADLYLSLGDTVRVTSLLAQGSLLLDEGADGLGIVVLSPNPDFPVGVARTDSAILVELAGERVAVGIGRVVVDVDDRDAGFVVVFLIFLDRAGIDLGKDHILELPLAHVGPQHEEEEEKEHDINQGDEVRSQLLLEMDRLRSSSFFGHILLQFSLCHGS